MLSRQPVQVLAPRCGPSPAAGIRQLALLGLVFYAINQGAVFVAVDRLTVATTSLVLSLTPLLVTAVSRRAIGELPSTNLIVGAMLVPVGSLAYLSGDLGATAIGLIAAFVALTANTVATLMGRSVNRTAHTSPLVTTAVSMPVRRCPPARHRIRWSTGWCRCRPKPS